MKTTIHSGRMAHFGHNDRKNTDKETHIDKEKSSQNFYWTWNERENITMSFRESEKLFYETQFGEYLEAKNKNTGGHSERVQTMEQYMTSHKSVARETLYYIGNAKEHPSEETIKQIVLNQIAWQQKTFPQVGIVSIAYHVDEEGAPHFHEREVFCTIDRTYGKMCVNGKKCLEDMNIPLPEPDKPEGKYNNRLMTYTKLCREHFQKLCRSYGLEIETEPTGKGGLSLMEYKISEKKNTIEELEKQKDAYAHGTQAQMQAYQQAVDLCHSLQRTNNELKSQNTALRVENEEIRDVNEHLRTENEKLRTDVHGLKTTKINLTEEVRALNEEKVSLRKLIGKLKKMLYDIVERWTERRQTKLESAIGHVDGMLNAQDTIEYKMHENGFNQDYEDFYER